MRSIKKRTIKYIWSDTRSRLTSSRVHKLVYVYLNQRVLNREQNAFTQESWDQFFQDVADQPEEEEVQPESVDVEEDM
jgi:hypothetical protein